MTDNPDTPRTPRALPTREQIADVIAFAWGEWKLATAPKGRLADAQADAVLALIDKENTMPDEPTAPCALIEGTQARYDGRIFTVFDAGTMVHARSGEEVLVIHRELFWDVLEALDSPKPPAPRLRVVNLDGMPLDGGVGYWRAWTDEVSQQPDFLSVLRRELVLGRDRDDTDEQIIVNILTALGVPAS